LSIEVVGIPTVRAADGLALSSRNAYLTAAQRERAPNLYATLQQVRSAYWGGERDCARLESSALRRLAAAGFDPEYVEIRDSHTLARPAGRGEGLIVLAAARLGQARLIDNLRLSG